MVLSKAGEYGIRIVLHLALCEKRGDGGYQPAHELARDCGIPVHFLGKVCQRLTRAGILISNKGPRGGVALARPSAEIAAIDVIEALGGTDGFSRCVLGLDLCNDDEPCPLHEPWRGIKQRIVKMFSGKTVAQLAGELQSERTVIPAAAAASAEWRRR